MRLRGIRIRLRRRPLVGVDPVSGASYGVRVTPLDRREREAAALLEQELLRHDRAPVDSSA